MDTPKSELTVIMKAKDLCSYVVTVTQKSPKQFRFTFVSRLQNLAMEVIENIYRASAAWPRLRRGRDAAPSEASLAAVHKAYYDILRGAMKESGYVEDDT